jgi:outer membrane protein TolC
MNAPLRLHRRRSWFAWAICALLALRLAAPPATAQPAPAAPAPSATNGTNGGPTLTLTECLQIANERQPTIAAARASLCAKMAACKGLKDLHPPSFLAPDLPIRRKQCCRGLDAAQAELYQVEYDTAYAVMRMYFTAVYAKQQLEVADDVVGNLRLSQKLVSEIINDPNTGPDTKINADTLAKLTIYLRLAESKRSEANVGVDRALAALREAMGHGCDCGVVFYPADKKMPEPQAIPDKCQIVELALCRRGELVQATVAADVTRLEIDAQGAIRLKPKASTFAAGSDVHAKSLPTGLNNGEYKPGAVGVEMPGLVAGNREARMKQICHYADRACSVVEKTRGLITLEAEDAYFKWREATDKVVATREAAKLGRELSDRTKRNRGVGNIKEEDLLQNDVLAGTAQAQYNEALFHQILALANLERITAGGFYSGLVPETVMINHP